MFLILMYFTLTGSLFYNFISYLNNTNNQENKRYFEKINNLKVSNFQVESITESNCFDHLKKAELENEDNIMLYLKNDSPSVFLLLFANKYYKKNIKIVFNMTYNDDTYIRNLCNRLDLDYRNLNSLDSSFNVESINYFNKNFILSLCKLYNFKNCFTSMTEDDFSKLYLDMIFKNEFTFNTKNKTKFRKNDVSIYNILNYTTNEEINNMLTGYNFVCIDKNKYHLDYFNNLDDLNYYWRNNLSNNYLELKKNQIIFL